MLSSCVVSLGGFPTHKHPKQKIKTQLISPSELRFTTRMFLSSTRPHYLLQSQMSLVFQWINFPGGREWKRNLMFGQASPTWLISCSANTGCPNKKVLLLWNSELNFFLLSEPFFLLPFLQCVVECYFGYLFSSSLCLSVLQWITPVLGLLPVMVHPLGVNIISGDLGSHFTSFVHIYLWHQSIIQTWIPHI